MLVYPVYRKHGNSQASAKTIEPSAALCTCGEMWENSLIVIKKINKTNLYVQKTNTLPTMSRTFSEFCGASVPNIQPYVHLL